MVVKDQKLSSLRTFKTNNEPLAKKLNAAGAFLVHKREHVFFEKNGEFVPYPPGYITGPMSCADGFYVSVQGPDGWRQRTYPHGKMAEAEEWALTTAKQILENL